jgi:hypothetical protein
MSYVDGNAGTSTKVTINTYLGLVGRGCCRVHSSILNRFVDNLLTDFIRHVLQIKTGESCMDTTASPYALFGIYYMDSLRRVERSSELTGLSFLIALVNGT